MNKTKTILAVAGGVIGLAILVMAYFTWDAFARKSAAFEGNEEEEGLETYAKRVSTLLGKKPAPNAANTKQLGKNKMSVEEWKTAMWRYAGVGDWCAPEGITPALFKESIVRDARRLAGKPGNADGKFMKPDFAFGPFKEYLADKLPPKDKMARLQRQWHDIMSLCDLLATNGVSQIVDLQVVEREAEAPVENKGAKASAKQRKAAAAAARRQPSVETYKISFQTGPASFVAVVRLLSFQERFTIVDDFKFVHVRDAISEALGVGEKAEATTAASTRRNRRRRGAVEEQKQAAEPEKKNTVVFDPEKDSLLQVELTVSVCDFRTLEDDKEGTK